MNNIDEKECRDCGSPESSFFSYGLYWQGIYICVDCLNYGYHGQIHSLLKSINCIYPIDIFPIPKEKRHEDVY